MIAVHAESFVPPGSNPPTGCGAVAPASDLPPGSGLALLLLYGFAALLLWQLSLRLGPERRLGALVALGTGSAFLVVFLVPPGLRPARAQATPGITYYHQDHLGSTVIVTGSPAATRVVYAPFGKVVAETAGGGAAAPDVGFTGQRFEAAVGLYDYGARWYHPDLGHFLTPDALVPDAYDSQSLNRYAYVRNDPINRIDPDGRQDLLAEGLGWSWFHEEFYGAPTYDWNDPGFQSMSAGFVFASGLVALHAVYWPAALAVDAYLLGSTFSHPGGLIDPIFGPLWNEQGLTEEGWFLTGGLAGGGATSGLFTSRSAIARSARVGLPREVHLVDLASPARRAHILDGEILPGGRYSGGHRAGTGNPGKSEFPASWSDDLIMHYVSDVATDPLSLARSGQRPGDVFVSGIRDGIEIDVLIRDGEIWAAYPTNVPRNP